MSNHRAQLQGAKADFVKKLTYWIDQIPKDAPSQSLTEAALMQRILDVHAFHEKKTHYLYDFNRDLISRIREKEFMALRSISKRDEYARTLFGFFWSKSGLSKVKADTNALVQQWFDCPEFQTTFPYTLFRDVYIQVLPKPEPRKAEPPKAEPNLLPKAEPIPDAWDDDAWNE